VKRRSAWRSLETVQRINTLPIPTVALLQGGCFGGGTHSN
jgi:methylglutaconyl-CoA hydratase